MAGSFGDADGVRRLGQALLTAGRELNAVSRELSGQVKRLVPDGWSGDSANGFSSDWQSKAGQAGQLAALCIHVGQVLVTLAGELDTANRQSSNAQQMTGGPASRFADLGGEQKSQRMLSQATGAAEQARAAARTKLAGIKVPRIGPPLTVSQVDAWAGRLAPGEVPVFKRLFGGLLGDARDFARRTGLATAWGTAENMRVTGLETVGQEAHFAEGIADGLTGMLRGVADLAPGPDSGLGRWLFGDQSASQAWSGLSNLAASFTGAPDTASAPAEQGLGKSLLAWDEWHTDPARAAGNVFFNLGSIFLPGKVLSLKTDSAVSDTAEAAEEDGTAESTAVRAEPDRPPGLPPAAFGGRDQLEVGGDRLDLPSDKAEQLEYREPLTTAGESVPLFDGKPVPGQAIQQDLGDCGLVVTLRAVARYRSEALQGALRATPDGRVIVRLHQVMLSGYDAVPTGRTIDVPVTRDVPSWKDSGTEFGIPASRASWAAMAEKALAALDERWTDARIKVNDGLWRQQAELRGLRNEDEIKALIDARGYARLDRGLTDQEVAELMAELTGERAGVRLLRSRHVESALSRLVRERKPLIVTSRAEKERVDPRAFRVTSGHAYEVTGIEDGKVIMKNPWGGYDPEPVPAGDFLKEFNNLIVTLG